MGHRWVIIATGIVLSIGTIAALTAFALLADVHLALWGLALFFTILAIIRLTGPRHPWLKARSRMFDVTFLLLVAFGLVMTISFATTPSPI